MVRSGIGTLQKKLPRTLGTVGIARHRSRSSSMRSSIFCVMKCPDPIGMPNTLTPSGCLISHFMDILGNHTCSVPTFGLPLMQVDSCVPQQGLLQQLVDPPCLVGRTCTHCPRTHLIALLATWQPRPEEWHQGIALLTTFCGDRSVPFLIQPSCTWMVAHRESHKWQKWHGLSACSSVSPTWAP